MVYLKRKEMDTLVIEKSVREEQRIRDSFQPVKKNFEEACTECDAVPLEIFIDELRKRVKEGYRNITFNPKKR